MESFVCEKCSKEFKSKRSLGQHKGWCLNPDREPTTLTDHKQDCSCGVCKTTRGEVPSWNKGLTKYTSNSLAVGARKISKSRAGKTYEEIYGEVAGPKMRKQRSMESVGRLQTVEKSRKISEKLTGRELSEEHKRKLRENWDTNHTVESIQRAGIASRSSYKVGWFNSTKCNTKIWYQSSYELKAYQKLEEDSNIISYSRCNFKIPFIFEGIQRRYIPDIHVKVNVGKDLIIEIKPDRFKNTPENSAKRNAGIVFCNTNNLEYLYWTEADLNFQPTPGT